MSPIAKTSGWPGTDRSGSTDHAPATSGRRAKGGRQALGPDTRSPTRSSRPAAACRRTGGPAPFDPIDAHTEAHVDAAAGERPAGASEDVGWNGASRRSPISTRVMLASRTGSCAEVAGEDLPVQLAQPAGHLDAGRAASADDDVEDAVGDQRRILGRFLEAAEDVDPQGDGVVDVLQRQRVLVDARHPEVVGDGTTGQHQHVDMGRARRREETARSARSTEATRPIRTVTLEGRPRRPRTLPRMA